MRRAAFVFVLFAIPLLVAALGLLAHEAMQRFERPGPLAQETTVVIPRGAGLEAIAQSLAAAGAIEAPWLFVLGVRYEGRARDLKAGEYSLSAGISMRQAMELLAAGRTVAHRLTVPEGVTSLRLVALINDAQGLDGKIEAIPAEGSLLPETYHYSLNDSRDELLARMAQARDSLMAELWPKRSEGLPLKSPEEAVILASIVERETAVPEEGALVAGVFINRLKKGMRLQSDPTVIYGLSSGLGQLDRALLRKDLKVATPYNTYMIDGLPPGPIANPGRAALEAVLHPAETEFLYFVADGSGGHVFAKTLKEHNRNVAKWRKIRDKRSQSE